MIKCPILVEAPPLRPGTPKRNRFGNDTVDCCSIFPGQSRNLQPQMSRVGLERTQHAAHVSPAPSIHSVRRVFPNTVGSAVFYQAPFRLATFDACSSVSRPLAYVQALLSPHGAIALQPCTVQSADRAHRPLAQGGLSYPPLQSLLRPDAPVSETLPDFTNGYPRQSLPSRAVSVTFPSLPCHALRTCRDPYRAGGTDFA